MLDFIKALLSSALGGALSAAIVLGVGILIRRFWRLRPPKSEERNLNGLWLAQFSYKLEKRTISKTHVILVRHYRNHVTAKYLAGDAPPYMVAARLRFKNYISGTWDNFDINDDTHGSFILTFPPGERGLLVKGLWVGVDKETGIATSIYQWRRITPRLGKDNLNRAELTCERLSIPLRWTGPNSSTDVWPTCQEVIDLANSVDG